MGEQPDRPASIRDVARAAGVSTATVSNVYNNKSEMAAATRERVLEVGARLGYRPSAIGRALRSGRSRVLGIVVGFGDSAVWQETYMPYYRDVIAGAALEAVGHGYSIVAAPAHADGRIDTHLPLDGVILVDPVPPDPIVDYCARHGIAVVTDGGYPPYEAETVRLRSVRVNLQQGLPALLDLMRSRSAQPLSPALFVGPRLDSYSTDTIEVYQAWCASRGATPLVWALQSGEDPLDAAARLFRDHGSDLDAIHSLNETYSNAVLSAARDLGLAIPAELQLSVVGRASASSADPRVNYLDVDPVHTGAVCVRTLIALLEAGDAVSHEDVVLDARVLPGGSLGH
jgi:DNA-binding LacI/PurR family transcriptional regulator